MHWRLTTDPGPRRRTRGFTLVELLVVISIIALLISILLPSLSKAREQAKSVVCATRIKGILTAMSLYATESNDFIAGSPNTTGSVLFSADAANILDAVQAWKFGPVQVWDWGGGMARQFNMRLSTRPFIDRFKEIRNMKAFLCPSNKFITDAYPPFGGGAYDTGPGRMISYNTSRNFMYPETKAQLMDAFTDPNARRPRPNVHWAQHGCGWFWYDRITLKPQRGYLPRTDMIGTPADKVFIADGARYVDLDDGPDTQTEPYARYGGTFSDTGPYTDEFTRSWNRTAGWNPGGANQDPRIYSYRHGKKQGFLPLGNYKMNVGFFDGHVESMNDIKSANPHHWIPRGFKLPTEEAAPDVVKKYFAEEPILVIR